MLFNNLATGPLSSPYRIDLDNVRSGIEKYSCCGSNPPPATTDAGACDGTSLWDGNAPGLNGWPCRDQIGRGRDSALFDTTTYAASTSEPAYFWANKSSTGADVLAGISNGTNNWIQTDRDYYDYAASFNGTSGVGCGTPASRPSTCTTGVGFWATNQSCTDLTRMVGVSPAMPISGTLYKCTATDTWMPYYTPYAYPHPLRAEAPDTTPPAEPQGLRIQ